MAVFKYKVEGIYEIERGNGADIANFDFEIELSRFYPEGAGSHILRRFLPILIRNQKKQGYYSKIKHFIITDVQKVSDEFPLVGKEISQMDEYEIQELACMYDIFSIPLPYTESISDLRLHAMEAYMKRILHIPLDTPEDLLQLGFYKKQIDGSIQLDLGEQKLVVELVNDFLPSKKEVKKKTLDDFRKNVIEPQGEGVLKITGEFSDNEIDNQQNSLFPSLEQLGKTNKRLKINKLLALIFKQLAFEKIQKFKMGNFKKAIGNYFILKRKEKHSWQLLQIQV